MGTRAMIALQRFPNGIYELYYRHMDGYPTGLGAELIEAMKETPDIDQVLKKVDSAGSNRGVTDPKDAFLQVQSDLEWIYVIENPESETSRSLTILKTSCPTDRDYVFMAWFSYQQYFSETYAEDLRMVEKTAEMALEAIKAFSHSKPSELIKA